MSDVASTSSTKAAAAMSSGVSGRCRLHRKSKCWVKTAMTATSAMSAAKIGAADGTLTSRTRAKWYHQEQLPPHPASCDTQPGTGHNRAQPRHNRQWFNDQLIPLVGQSMPDTWGPQRVWRNQCKGILHVSWKAAGRPAGCWQHWECIAKALFAPGPEPQTRWHCWIAGCLDDSKLTQQSSGFDEAGTFLWGADWNQNAIQCYSIIDIDFPMRVLFNLLLRQPCIEIVQLYFFAIVWRLQGRWAANPVTLCFLTSSLNHCCFIPFRTNATFDIIWYICAILQCLPATKGPAVQHWELMPAKNEVNTKYMYR